MTWIFRDAVCTDIWDRNDSYKEYLDNNWTKTLVDKTSKANNTEQTRFSPCRMQIQTKMSRDVILFCHHDTTEAKGHSRNEL